MKKFLQSLQCIQDECIDEVKKSKASQLPGTVAGVTIHSVGQHVSREEWEQMRKNISEHSKEWRKFSNDPNKIVLEKNFFINCLNFMQAFYVFRPIDDYGNTYIQVSDSFFNSKPKSSAPNLLAVFLILACALILASVYYSPWLVIPGIFFIPIAIWAERQRVKKQKIKESDWQKSFTNRPGAILPPAVFSKKYSKFANLVFAKQKGAVIHKNTRASVVKIDLTSSPFFSDYKA
ncbi:MAG: hypothetical protein WAW11_01405, partial [Patescibacteria group bacterium]